jgi:phage-related holin
MNQDATTGFLGFSSVKDFSYSFVGAKSWIMNTALAVVGSVTTFIANYMWDDPKAVWLLWALMGADWATGIIKSKIKKRFVSYKLWRMPLYFVATAVVISLSWWLSKMYLVFHPLPAIVMCGFYSVYFISLLENLGESGFLPKPIVKLLKSKFGLKKLFPDEEKGQ